MGNRLIISAPHKELKGPSQECSEFFKRVRVKWLDYFISELKIRMGIASDQTFDLNSKDILLKWKDYFSIFSKIEEIVEEERLTELRFTWHVATLGYIMERDQNPLFSPILPPPPPGFPEDFTDASDLSESESEDEEGVNKDTVDKDTVQIKKLKVGKDQQRNIHIEASKLIGETTYRSLPDGWDPTIISPIYYGYKLDKSKEVEDYKRENERNLIESEKRAIERALEHRNNSISEVEAVNKSREATRLKKISEIENTYKSNELKREEDLKRNKESLPPDAFKLFKTQWDQEFHASLEAFETEIEILKNVNYLKSTNDRNALRRKLEDLDAFKDAEAQDMPSAERLEQISRVELHHWSDILDKRTKDLEKAKNEYVEVKSEVLQNLTSENKAKATEAKTLLNYAEASVRSKQKDLRSAIEALSDAEVLLNRAIRMKSKQDRLLPLFKLIAGEDLPRNCRFDLFFAALSILVVGTFDMKVDLLLNILCPCSPGYLCISEFQSIVYLYSDTLYRLKLIPISPNLEDLKNVIFRSFFEIGLTFDDNLTYYEAKTLLRQLCSHSMPASLALGINKLDKRCTYQRNVMSPLKLLELGYIGSNTCKYRTHYEITRYKPQLEPSRVQLLHERAFTMGEDDPLRPDYSRFIKSKLVKKRSDVDPLRHGYLINRFYLKNQEEEYFITKIQSFFRSKRARLAAEIAAKQKAFEEAKEAAVNEMKKSVMEEFRVRESGVGVGKLKWDAAVRMKQAKLRTEGQVANRADTVMIMMEEAVLRAMEEIDARFLVIAEKEGYGSAKKHEVVRHVEETGDLLQIFGLPNKSAIQDSDNLVDKLETPRPDEDDEEKKGLDDVDKEENNNSNKASSKLSAMSIISPDKSMEMIKGSYFNDLQSKGETNMEKEMRLSMASSAPDFIQLKNRLRVINKAFSLLKTNEFLSELPTKRLIIQFVAHLSLLELTRQIANHFNLSKDSMVISDILKNIASSDLEYGVLRLKLNSLRDRVDIHVTNCVEKEIKKYLPSIDSRIKSRMRSTFGSSELDILKEEQDKIEEHIVRFKDICSENLENSNRLKEKINKSIISILEMQKRKSCVEMLSNMKLGSELKINISIEARQSWMKRLISAYNSIEVTKADIEAKYSEIRLLANEFLEYATAGAQTIIREYYQPKYLKTIPVVQETKVDGRPSFCGRGLEGKSLVFEAHNIVYRVMTDDHGIFNGSDELAAKSASNERIGSLQYLKTHVKKLNIPMIATIDYFGFRVLAVSKLQCEDVIFNDEGEIRKVKEDLVHGIINKGDNFINKSKTANALMKSAAGKLNLMEHQCKGLKDISSSHTSCSAEIKIYKNMDDEYFAKDFWLAMPAEHPEYTPHLSRESREQSVFWRLLRPELLKHLQVPVSSNTFNALTYSVPDRDQQLENSVEATKYLIDKIIPDFLNNLSDRNYLLPLSQGLGLNIPTELHCRGINVRHIGLLRRSLYHKCPGYAKLFFNENFIRTTRDIQDEILNGDIIKIAGFIYSVHESPGNLIRSGRIPIAEVYLGDAIERVSYSSGANFMKTDKNCSDLTTLLLAEMVARAIKELIKLQLRMYAKEVKGTSPEFLPIIYCEYFNVITGSHPNGFKILQEEVFEKIREKYGKCAIRSNERDSIQVIIQPTIPYIIKRLQTMVLGVQLSFACISEFNERPLSFSFCPVDFIDCSSIVRHNLPFMILADAVLVTLRAEEAEEYIYELQVKIDKPSLYFPLDQRKGTVDIENRGLVASKEVGGKISSGCVLERQGPIKFNPLSRSILFDPESKSKIDTKYHNLISPVSIKEHFSVEVFLKCTGGTGTRVALMTGRFGIQINRENEWVFLIADGIHELYLRIAPVDINEWVHIVGTFDGTTLRCYKNSILQSSLEVDIPFAEKKKSRMDELAEKKNNLLIEENDERELQKAESMKQAENYFKTREGMSEMKRSMKNIMESYEFQSKNLGVEEKDPTAAARVKKTEALKQARQEYTTEVYIKNVHSIAARYSTLRDEVDNESLRDQSSGEARSLKPLRIGASCLGSVANNYFQGYLSQVSIYSNNLSADRVLAHYLSASLDRTKDAQRLHAVASARYEEALNFAADDPIIMKNYAKSLCRILRIESSSTSSMSVSRGKIKIKDAIETYSRLLLPEGIGEILLELPKDTNYADILTEGIMAIFKIDSFFFSRSKLMSREHLVDLPDEFALGRPESPSSYIQAAAKIYQEVSKDSKLAKKYGEINLSFIQYLKSSELIVAIIQCIREDSSLNIVNVGEIFKSSNIRDINVTDDDVQVLTESLALSTGFDLSYCSLISNQSLEYISRLSNIRIVNFEGCINLTDGCLDPIADFCYMTLEVLSMAGNRNISDNCLNKISMKCRSLTLMNFSNCPNISFEIINKILTINKRVNTLLLSATYLTNEGLSQMSNVLSSKHLTNLDISFCREISDSGISSLAEKCTSLTSINLCGLNRITDEGARFLLSNCWYLKQVSFEDIFLLDDSAFWFNRDRDGRPAADENMLTSLTSLNLKDCINISDQAIAGLAERCRNLQILSLNGCEKLSQTGLNYLANPLHYKVGMSDSLKVLDLSYCSSVSTTSLLDLLETCASLEDLTIDGLISVNDDFVHQMCLACKTITKLSMQRCQQITDASLCSITDYLWIETLNISNCSKITDMGIETFSLVCSGIQSLIVKKCSKLTNKALFSLIRNCKDLRLLDVSECPFIDNEAITNMSKFNKNVVRLVSSYNRC